MPSMAAAEAQPRITPPFLPPDKEWFPSGPSSFAIIIPPTRLTISFGTALNGGDIWYAFALNWFGKTPLKAQEAEAAKTEALLLLKSKLKETVSAINALVPKKKSAK